MKEGQVKSLIIGAAFALLVWAGYGFAWPTGAQAADNGPRFERLLDEHHDVHTNHAVIFEVWHDRLSGKEFTCIEARDTNSTGGIDGKAWPITCFNTGREW